MKNINGKIIFYAPGTKKFFNDWEWYKSDKSVLEEIGNEVLVCYSISELIRSLLGVKLIYCTWWHTSFPAIMIGKLFRIPVIVTGALHMFDSSGVRHFYSANKIFQILNRIGLKFADANLFISYDQMVTISNNLNVNNPYVVYTSLAKKTKSVLELTKSRKYNNLKKTSINICTVLWQKEDQLARKGLWASLDAIRIIKNKKDINFHWYIIGRKGDGTKTFSEAVAKNHLDSCVTILNDATPDEKNNIFLSCDIYLQPSWCEGLGWAVVEAMSQGCIPIVSRYAAQPETVPSFQYIVESITGYSIAEKLTEICGLDVRCRQRLSKQCIEYVNEKFSHKNHVLAIEQILNQLNKSPFPLKK